ncbi:hypothetical protein [Stutzerimonas frequens]|uniref:hypothetical protein n=1 Tax=Stutzerimonas frequens TaxID=2968969 RepID=UPI0007BA2F23|nr:hypothetical protein [Stutzerimonas frequens]KZX65150.1 hypothetical protein A3710_00230 [Stutzerimonas frequens]MBA4727233.1 hypothetical protein [Pseudomonas sp.]MBK3918615.1 hypothetical protein [Stutzerimonas frequens]MUT71793.1 hypothetical protein [Stutzerimonas frequens]
MLTMTLFTWLLAATPSPTGAPVAADLGLQPLENNRVALSLCFKGSGQQVRFRLKVRSSGSAGTSQSTQSGTLIADATSQCPVRNRLGIAADTEVEAELQWWIDDAEQPPLLRRYPGNTGDTDEREEPDQPQQIA